MLYNTDEDHCLACQVGAFWNNSIQTLYVCRVGSYGVAGPTCHGSGWSSYFWLYHNRTLSHLPIPAYCLHWNWASIYKAIKLLVMHIPAYKANMMISQISSQTTTGCSTLTNAFIWPASGYRSCQLMFSKVVHCVQCACTTTIVRLTYLCNQMSNSDTVVLHNLAKIAFWVVWDCTCTTNQSHELTSVKPEPQKMTKVTHNPVWIYSESLKFAAPCSTSALLCLAESKCRHTLENPINPKGFKLFASSTASDNDSVVLQSLTHSSESLALWD